MPEPEFRQEEDFRVVIWRRAGKETGKETGNENTPVVLPDAHVIQLIEVMGERRLAVKDMMALLGLKGDDNFRTLYLNPAVRDGYVTLLYPDKPRRKGQAYYLSEKGLRVLREITRK